MHSHGGHASNSKRVLKKRTDLVETSLGRKDGDVAIVTCSSTHNGLLFSCLFACCGVLRVCDGRGGVGRRLLLGLLEV